MGPQLDSCGRNGTWVEIMSDDELQWGRNLIVAEGAYSSKSIHLVGQLQWGRNLIVAEGRWPAVIGFARAQASMGPQLDSCGRIK